MSSGSVLRAGILAGLVGAVLVATPLLNKLNFCCCALSVATAVLAAWMLRSDSAGTAGADRCALAGMISGIVSALVGIPLGAILSRLAFGTAHLHGQVDQFMEALRRELEGSGQPAPPGFLESFESGLRATSGLEINSWLVVATFLFAIVQALFGLLGGFLGALMTKRNAVPPLPPPSPPPSPPPPPASSGDSGVAPGDPLESSIPADSAPAVVDEQGHPDVRWGGPVVEGIDSPDVTDEAGAASVEEASSGRGEIPADELPFLPAKRDEPEDPSPS